MTSFYFQIVHSSRPSPTCVFPNLLAPVFRCLQIGSHMDTGCSSAQALRLPGDGRGFLPLSVPADPVEPPGCWMSRSSRAHCGKASWASSDPAVGPVTSENPLWAQPWLWPGRPVCTRWAGRERKLSLPYSRDSMNRHSSPLKMLLLWICPSHTQIYFPYRKIPLRGSVCTEKDTVKRHRAAGETHPVYQAGHSKRHSTPSNLLKIQ